MNSLTLFVLAAVTTAAVVSATTTTAAVTAPAPEFGNAPGPSFGGGDSSKPSPAPEPDDGPAPQVTHATVATPPDPRHQATTTQAATTTADDVRWLKLPCYCSVCVSVTTRVQCVCALCACSPCVCSVRMLECDVRKVEWRPLHCASLLCRGCWCGAVTGRRAWTVPRCFRIAPIAIADNACSFVHS